MLTLKRGELWINHVAIFRELREWVDYLLVMGIENLTFLHMPTGKLNQQHNSVVVMVASPQPNLITLEMIEANKEMNSNNNIVQFPAFQKQLLTANRHCLLPVQFCNVKTISRSEKMFVPRTD